VLGPAHPDTRQTVKELNEIEQQLAAASGDSSAITGTGTTSHGSPGQTDKKKAMESERDPTIDLPPNKRRRGRSGVK
jgi:hypothetical protein